MPVSNGAQLQDAGQWPVSMPGRSSRLNYRRPSRDKGVFTRTTTVTIKSTPEHHTTKVILLLNATERRSR